MSSSFFHVLRAVPGMEGLSFCCVCGGAEGSLPTQCPGEKMPYRVEQRVWAGLLDFKDGAWRQRKVKGLILRFKPHGCPGTPADAVDRWGSE